MAIYLFYLFTLFYTQDQPIWKACNMNGRPIPILDSSARPTIIFYGSYSCKPCYDELNEVLSHLTKDTSSIRILALLRASSVVSKRLMLGEAASMLPPNTTYVFDIQDPDVTDSWPPHNLTSGLWGYFNVSYGPALIIIIPGKTVRFKYLSHTDLFSTSTTLETENDKAPTLKDHTDNRLSNLILSTISELGFKF